MAWQTKLCGAFQICRWHSVCIRFHFQHDGIYCYCRWTKGGNLKRCRWFVYVERWSLKIVRESNLHILCYPHHKHCVQHNQNIEKNTKNISKTKKKQSRETKLKENKFTSWCCSISYACMENYPFVNSTRAVCPCKDLIPLGLCRKLDVHRLACIRARVCV